MKPRHEQQSDLLDIIFENRNKAYGAYYLRRHYQSYLWRAIIIMVAGLCAIIFFAGIQKPKKIFSPFTISPTIPVRTTLIVPDIPPAPATPKTIVHQNIATEKLSTLKIVPPDEQVDKPMPDIANIIDKKISLLTKQGMPGDIAAPEENIVAAAGEGVAPTAAPIGHSVPYNNNAVDEAAEFPGGLKAMLRFLQRNLHNPKNEMAAPVQVRIQFIIDETGTAGSFKIIQSGGEMFDQEVLSTLKKMPRWKPAVKNGREVPVYFVQPITFDILSE